jgi:arylsulfatase A
MMGSQSLSVAGLAGKKPNIVFVLTETLGIGGVSCYGADNFQTPNLDRLAKDGTRFTHAYTAPLTGPSRVLILTGRYAFRTGATSQDGTGRIEPSTETMLPRILKPAGYATAAVGKWGLPLGPAEFGFDEYLQFNGSGVYWNKQANGKTYTVNGEVRSLRDKEYMPDVMHEFLIDFITRRRARPFYVYYAMCHMRAEMLRTPDSAPDSKDYYTDNIVYMDKLVGRLVGELDRLNLRENTLIVFVSDSGTGAVYAGESTVAGRRLSGEKGSMLEGGSLVPLIVNWPDQTPAGKVCPDLIDASDFLPTLVEVAGATLPENTVIDGRSFAPQLYGRSGQPRDSVYVQLGGKWYVREAGWKLNQAGELFDMSHAPFEEPKVPADTKAPAAIAARARLQAALDKLNPAGGILDDGDGTGRPASRLTNKKKKSRKNQDR